MEALAQSKYDNMAKIKTVLCLGNQTDDSVAQTKIWAERFCLPYLGLTEKNKLFDFGIMTSDLGQSNIDNLWTIADNVDLLLMLDQEPSTYDHFATYQHYISLCKYKKHFQTVMIAKHDAPDLWLTNFKKNQDILTHVQNSDICSRNMVIKLSEVDNIESFEKFLVDLIHKLKQRNCKWVFYRAGRHEELHTEASNVLLQYPEFVYLNPGVFNNNVEKNIQLRVYLHWIDLYCKKP